MSVKLCKTVLKLLVQDIDKAAFRAEVSVGTVLQPVIEEHPEITVSEEEWNKMDEDARNAIIDRVKQTLGTIG